MNIKNVTIFVMFMTISLVSPYLKAQCNGGTITPTNNWALNKSVQVTDFYYSNNFFDESKMNDGNMSTYATLNPGNYGDPGDYEIVIDLGSDKIVDFLKLKYASYDSRFFMDIQCYDSYSTPVYTYRQEGISYDGNLEINSVVRYIKVYFQSYTIDTQCHFYELQAWSTLGNVALNGITTCSYNDANYPSANAVDGKETTYCNATDGTNVSRTFEVNFVNPAKLSHIEMVWSNTLASCVIKGFRNGVWYQFNTSNLSSSTIVCSDPTLMQQSGYTKIKIEYTKTNPTEVYQLKELRVFGKQTSYTSGTFIDSRDGNAYPTFTNNGLMWFQKNLDYNYCNHSWYYNNTVANKSYGRYYDRSDLIGNDICPSGWRLPDPQEFINLGYSVMETGVFNNFRGGHYISWTGLNYWEQLDVFGEYMTSQRWINYVNGYPQDTLQKTAKTWSYYPGVVAIDDLKAIRDRFNIRCVKNSSKSMTIAKDNSYYGNFMILRENKELAQKIESESEFNIFPNPSKGIFDIILPENLSNVKITILNAEGRIVKVYEGVKESKFHVNLPLLSGVYLLKIQSPDYTKIEKLIIQ